MYPSPAMTDHPSFRHYDAGVPRTLGAYPARTLLDYPDLAPYKVRRRLLPEDEELVS